MQEDIEARVYSPESGLLFHVSLICEHTNVLCSTIYLRTVVVSVYVLQLTPDMHVLDVNGRYLTFRKNNINYSDSKGRHRGPKSRAFGMLPVFGPRT